MKFLKHYLIVILLLLVLMPVSTFAEISIGNTSGTVTRALDTNNVIEIDGVSYELHRNTKFGYMISPTSIQHVDREEFPLDEGEQFHFSIERSGQEHRYPRLDFIYKRVD